MPRKVHIVSESKRRTLGTACARLPRLARRPPPPLPRPAAATYYIGYICSSLAGRQLIIIRRRRGIVTHKTGPFTNSGGITCSITVEFYGRLAVAAVRAAGIVNNT